MIVDHCLTIDVDDSYFFTGLSHQGDDISLFGSKAGGDITHGYIQRFCRSAPPKYG